MRAKLSTGDTRGPAGTREDTTYVWFGTVRRKEAEVLTAKPTAILSDIGNSRRTSADCWPRVSISSGRRQTLADVRNAVFKTVCGALLRRPGWVRFPSIPARFAGDDSK